MIAHITDVDIYKGDLERAERQFSVAQRLHSIAGDIPLGATPINMSNVDALKDGPNDFRLIFQSAGSYLIEQLTDDPIPKSRSSRETVWVPKLKFMLPIDDSGFRRPTSFEVDDIVNRRTQTSSLPLQPFSRTLLSVDLAFVDGNFITVKPAPEQLVLIGPNASVLQHEEFTPGIRTLQPKVDLKSSGTKQINLNHDADNRYVDSKAIDTDTESGLLSALEGFAEDHYAPRNTDPYIIPVAVSTIDVGPDDRLSTYVDGRRTLLQVGNDAINPHDRSRLMYSALSKFARTRVAESFGVIRMMTESGILTAFIIVDDSELHS